MGAWCERCKREKDETCARCPYRYEHDYVRCKDCRYLEKSQVYTHGFSAKTNICAARCWPEVHIVLHDAGLPILCDFYEPKDGKPKDAGRREKGGTDRCK